MQFLSLDLEMNQPSGKIIQIGACVGDLKSGELLGTYSALVRIDESLTPYIQSLTGITDMDLVAEGKTLLEAYEGLLVFRAQFPDIECNPLTWGGGDSQELRNQLSLNNSPHWPFGHRWLDVKTLYQFSRMAKGQSPQAGLAKAMGRYGMLFRGKKHNALYDAINTFHFAHRLTSDLK